MRFLIILVLSVACFLNSLFAESINDRLKQIPPEDRELLSKFFKRLCSHGDFSYTLLGQKPIGSIDYNLDLMAFPQFYKEPHKHLFLMALDEKGWEVWEKYKTLFPMQRYSLIKIREGSFFGFLLVNKKKAFEVIEDNLQVFQELVGEKISGREILTRLCQGKLGYYHYNIPCLVSYYKAFGLLYGYGKENVEGFEKREEIIQKLKNLPIEIKTLPLEVIRYLEVEEFSEPCKKCQQESAIDISSLNLEFLTLVDEMDLIQTANKTNPFLPIKRSRFLGNEKSLETQAIIESCDNLGSEILRIYESDDFLKTVLEILTS